MELTNPINKNHDLRKKEIIVLKIVNLLGNLKI